MLDHRLTDKWWRLTHLYKILDKNGNLITFVPNSIQRQHIKDRKNHRYNYILKYRQGGITTFYIIDALDEALWVSGMSCGIIAHEAKRLPEYFTIAKRAYENLPDWMKPKTKTDTKNMYEFVERFDGYPLDSKIYVATDIRGGTVQRLHITESAYIKDRRKLKASSKQAVPMTGWISEETTANGFDEFYDDYMGALLNRDIKEHDYKAHFYPWILQEEYQLDEEIGDKTGDEVEIVKIAKEMYDFDVTDKQLAWRRWKMRDLAGARVGVGLSAKQLFDQEYPLTVKKAFQTGAGIVFDAELLDTIEAVSPMKKDEVITAFLTQCAIVSTDQLNDEGKEQYKRLEWLLSQGVWFWKLPEFGRKYVLGCDPSDGQGSDNGVIDIWDDDNIEQVAQFYGKKRPDELAELVKEMAVFYNRAFAGVENNMLTTILFLIKIYDNYYSTYEIDTRTQKKTRKIGFNTNSKTRDVIIDRFIKLFVENNLIIRSAVTLSEMRTFIITEDGKREHAGGKHDDALFAGFIAVQMREYNRPAGRLIYRQ